MRRLGEMVDARDLKSLALKACRFESGRRHHKDEKALTQRQGFLLWSYRLLILLIIQRCFANIMAIKNENRTGL